MPDLEVDVPLADTLVEAFSPSTLDATIEVGLPGNGYVLPILLPRLMVFVTTSKDALVQFQYSTSYDFDEEMSLLTPVKTGVSEIKVFVDVVQPLINNTTYYWHARVTDGVSFSDWTPTLMFLVSTESGAPSMGVSWTVNDDVVPVPHLWFIVPPSGTEGEYATLYGAGFDYKAPDVALGWRRVFHPGKVVLEDIFPPISRWTPVLQTPYSYTDGRVIEHDGNVDPWHQEIDIAIPYGASPGGEIYVEGSTWTVEQAFLLTPESADSSNEEINEASNGLDEDSEE